MDRLNCSDPVTIVPYKLYNYSSENHGNECLILSCCGRVLVLFVHQVNLQCCVLHVLTTYTIIITNRQSVVYASLMKSVNHSTGLSLNWRVLRLESTLSSLGCYTKGCPIRKHVYSVCNMPKYKLRISTHMWCYKTLC